MSFSYLHHNSFIFQAFINTARELWKFAYLFKEVTNSCEYQENTNSIEKRIQSCIQETVEEMLPVREMLMEHVRDYVVDEDAEKDNSIEDEDDEDDDDDYIPKRKLKKGLKKRRGGANGVFPNTLLGGNELFAPASLPGPPAPVTPVSLPAPMTPASLPAPITPVSLPAPAAETLPVAPVALATPPAPVTPVTPVLLPDPAPVETLNDSMTDVKTVEIGNGVGNSHVSFNEPVVGMDGGMDDGMPTDLNFSDLADLPFTQL